MGRCLHQGSKENAKHDDKRFYSILLKFNRASTGPFFCAKFTDNHIFYLAQTVKRCFSLGVVDEGPRCDPRREA